MAKERFTAQEKRVFIGCFLAYCVAYTARLNLAAALPQLGDALRLTEARRGLIQTVFAVVYAVGQLVNGAIADRVSPRRHIVCGLLLSGACNLLFGLSGAYWQLLLCWALNGAAQSMLWTPIVRLIAAWFTGEKRARVSFLLCLSFYLGHALSWAASGALAALSGWRTSFLLPAGAMLAAALAAFALLDDRGRAPGQAAESAPNAPAARMPVRELLFKTGLALVLLSCVATGFSRDGVMTWAPTILSGLSGAGASLAAAATSLLIPAMNLLGLFLGQWFLTRTRGNIRAVAGALLLCAAALAAALVMLRAPLLLLYAFLLGGLCALLYCVSTLQTVMLPMEFFASGRVALAAGLCDCAMYVGSSLSGVLTGALMRENSARAAYGAWAAAALLAALCMALSARGRSARVKIAPRA